MTTITKKQTIVLILTLSTGKLLAGPVVLKLDSGPGRIVASIDSIAKREEYLERGLIILAGLPNATSVQQEMDVLFGAFKSTTYARGERVLMEKMLERSNTRAAALEGGAAPAIRPPSLLSLGFDDLATIVDGKPGEDVNMKPFTKH